MWVEIFKCSQQCVSSKLWTILWTKFIFWILCSKPNYGLLQCRCCELAFLFNKKTEKVSVKKHTCQQITTLECNF